MSETGFGSLSFSPLPTYSDWGFGSPVPPSLSDYNVAREISEERDTGFGSPYDYYEMPVEVSGEGAIIPDDGGVYLQIVAPWKGVIPNTPSLGNVGVFTADFINQSSGTRYKAIGERRNNCYTDFTQSRVFLGVPPIPRGAYDIEMRWTTGSKLIEDAFIVAVRPRCKESYALRKHIPSWTKRGVIDAPNELIEEYKEESVLSSILKSMGERIQVLGGRPCTGLSAAYSYGDTSLLVESTIGFPDNGGLFIGKHQFTYEGKTQTSFLSVASIRYVKDTLRPRSLVELDVNSI